MRAAMEAVLSTWRKLLGIDWHHVDIAADEPLPALPIQVLIVAPPTATWSRARHMEQGGPRALRSSRWPWGLPEVTGEDRAKVERENATLRHGLKIINEALNSNDALTFALVAPEDKGASAIGHPASVWQLAELRSWARERQLPRGALNQCEIGPSPTARPTGVLLHPLSTGSHARGTPLREGWPRRSPPPGCHDIGPLPRRCRCKTEHKKTTATIGNASSAFSSQLAARWFSRLLLRPHLQKRASALGLLRKGPISAQHTAQLEQTQDVVRAVHYHEDSDTDQTWPEPPSTDEEHFREYEDTGLAYILNNKDNILSQNILNNKDNILSQKFSDAASKREVALRGANKA